MKLRLTLPLPISINSLYVNQFAWNKQLKRQIPTGAKIYSKEGEQLKKVIQREVIYQMALQKDNWDYERTKMEYMYMDLIFYMNKKGRDADNCLKMLQDSLQGIVFHNDSHILPRVQKILYDHSKPHVEVLLRPVSYVGIFSTQDQLEAFEGHCSGCSRYSRGCSILRNAKDGFVQDEIQNNVCNAYKEKKETKKKKGV